MQEFRWKLSTYKRSDLTSAVLFERRLLASVAEMYLNNSGQLTEEEKDIPVLTAENQILRRMKSVELFVVFLINTFTEISSVAILTKASVV